ncbi:MAG: ABC transporter permease subunit [Alphaproteobacteria bacterium]|nr:ABC transporter permease subunit [Alphaproteobacteria bacterium]
MSARPSNANAGSFFVAGLPYGWLLAFVAAPLFVIAAISLTDPAEGVPPYTALVSRGDGTWRWTGDLDNYWTLGGDWHYVAAYLGSLRVAFVATLLTLLLGYPMAYAIARARREWRVLLLTAVMLPFWTSFLIRVYAWIGILNSNGFINTALLDLGLIEEPLALLYTEFAVYIGIIYAYLPFMVMPIFAVLERLDRAPVEAAMDLGARPITAFLTVTLPLSLHGVLAGCLLVFVPAVGEFVVPELLGGSDFLMIGQLLWTESFQNRDWPLAAAIAVALLLVVAVPILVLQKLSPRATRA